MAVPYCGVESDDKRRRTSRGLPGYNLLCRNAVGSDRDTRWARAIDASEQAKKDTSIYESGNYSNDIIEKITADELINLIQELPPRYRMVFNLFVMEDMNHKEICEVMRISEGTSKSNLARARDILKRKVTENYGETKANRNYPA